MKRIKQLALALALFLAPWMAEAQQVTSLALINATTDQDIPAFTPIPDNAIIDLNVVGTSLSIRASAIVTPTGGVGSVRFFLDDVLIQTENVQPYAIAGDTAGPNYNPWTLPPPGTHVLRVVPYTQANGGGTAGISLTRTFTLVPVIQVPPKPGGNVQLRYVVVPGRLVLTWTDNATNETGTRVERKENVGAYIQIADIALPDIVTYTDATLVAGSNYCYRVRVYNATDVSDYSNEACAIAQ